MSEEPRAREAARRVAATYSIYEKHLTAPIGVCTISTMEITFDPAKNAKNIAERGLSFDRVADFDFATAVYAVDGRRDYGETRVRALGMIAGRLHVLVFKATPGGIRAISLRRANKREVRVYEKANRP